MIRIVFLSLLIGAALADTAASAPLRVYAAGDIAECLTGDASESPAARTMRLVTPGAPVLVLGDAVYNQATAAKLASCYEPTWGRFKGSTYAIAGNHDYLDGRAEAFLDYFGRRNGSHTWFREPLGDAWWLIGLDSNVDASGLKEQESWLKHQLATIKGDGRCIIAMWHHALFSSGLHKGDGARMKPIWADLDAAGTDLVLTGHEHFYESFEPLDAEGQPKQTGIREFVVGTGGAELRDLSFSKTHRAYAREFGVLELDLDDSQVHWAFRTIKDTVLDKGEASCRNASLRHNKP
jgi:3',5'-cyclic AMP phosphodiesterase CpdA